MRSILYITYDGLTDSLGQSQILAYLKRLSGAENRIVILSFEKEALYAKEREKVAAIVKESGLVWIPLSYTKKPPVISTIKDVRAGLKKAAALHREYDFDIVHCRGYISALIGQSLKKKFGIRFIFDMRGWWPDEKIESGFWDRPWFRPVYSYFKKKEREFFRDCDYAVSLTYAGRDKIVELGMAPAEKIGVIPTCVDFDIFPPVDENIKVRMRQKLGIKEEEKVFVYSGSVGGNYDPQTLIDVFAAYRKIYPQSFLLILSKEELDEALRARFAAAGIDRMAIYNAPFTSVTDYLRAGDVSFIYYKMTFSTIGRSPTKMGEYWASGLPVIAFSGIGDLDHILGLYPGSGVLLSKNSGSWETALHSLQAADAVTLRRYAFDYFHVDKGVSFYSAAYNRLAPQPSPATV